MTKLDVEVGEDFPVREGHPRGPRHHHHHHDHGLHRRGPFARHRHHGGGRLALLLILAGLAALIAQHQLTPAIAVGLVIAGATLLVLRFAFHAAWHWRHRRAPVAKGV